MQLPMLYVPHSPHMIYLSPMLHCVSSFLNTRHKNSSFAPTTTNNQIQLSVWSAGLVARAEEEEEVAAEVELGHMASRASRI